MTDHNRKGILNLSFDELAHLCKFISIKDILNLSAMCHQLKDLLSNNLIWKPKFIQRWPSLKNTYTEYLDEDDMDMKEELKKGVNCEKVLLSCLSLMPYTNEISLQPHCVCEIEEFDPLFYCKEDTYPLRYYYFYNKLIKIRKHDPRNRETNLTHMHYTNIFLKHTIRYYVKNKWQALMNLEPEKKIVEKAALIVSQWYQPYEYLFYSHIADSLDNIAYKVLAVLRNRHPGHSIFATSIEGFQSDNISDNRWDKIEARQILDVLGEVIFQELQFESCHADVGHKYTDPQIFLIDQVLEKKKGSLLCLLIIIQAVARRLGVHCELMALGSHVLLRWIDSYEIDFKDENCYFIDIYKNGSVTRKTDYYHQIFPDDPAVSIKESALTITQMASRICESLENIYSANQSDHIHKDSSSKLLNILTGYSHENTNVHPKTDIISTMNSLKEHIESKCSPSYIRLRRMGSATKYAVGMLVKYKEQGFIDEDVGVIVAWDYSTNKCCQLKKRLTHPFYYIFGCNDKETYVAEPYVKPMNMSYWINHSDIGQFFSHFHETHYVPNQVHQLYFPKDMEILLQKCAKRRRLE